MQSENDLMTLNERWIRAWFEKDAATVELLMADDYVYVAPNGNVLDRSAILAIIRSPGYKIHNGARTEIKVRQLGGVAAVVRNRWQGEVEFEGQTFKEDHTCVMVCAREGEGWKVVYEQCSANEADERG